MDSESSKLNETVAEFKELVDWVKSIGLKYLPQYGGIPPHLKYPDHFLVGPDGDVSYEYYSFALNHVKIGTKTPLEMLRDACLTFKKEFQSYFDDGTFPEVLTSGG
jgi:hypothetical protein